MSESVLACLLSRLALLFDAFHSWFGDIIIWFMLSAGIRTACDIQFDSEHMS